MADTTAVETTTVQELVRQFDEAWNAHDADALADLHHPDAETVNRFGKYLVGDKQHRTQFQWLHAGPFSTTESPAQNVVSVRFVRPDVAIMHTTWRTPELHVEGERIAPEDMVVSYLVTKEAGRWGFAAVDLHNVASALGQEASLPDRGSSPLASS
jgi:uncharacterized protein (TIGR02246 family)